MCFCSYRYTGFADADEAAFASSIALQAYFEGREITKEDVDRCIDYWRNNISERVDPVGRKRSVMCEPFYLPFPTVELPYRFCCHFKRSVPYGDEDERNTKEIRAVYDKYNELCEKQNRVYATFTGPQRKSTVCQALGCRRVFGRRGLIFCTEECSNLCWLCKRKSGEPPPPFEHRDLDDDNDASIVLRKVLGEPPANVVYTRWVYDEEKNENVLVTYPATGDVEEGLGGSKVHDL